MAVVADRTYSFRAPASLADRLERAEQLHAALVTPELDRHFQRQLRKRLHERRQASTSVSPGQRVRDLAEAFVETIEFIEEEERVMEEMRAWKAAEPPSEDEEREALLRLSVSRIEEW